MKRLIVLTLSVCGVVVLASVVMAQPPAGFQMTPAIQAKMKAWQKFGESHKNVMSVQRTVFAISEMDNDARTKLTKKQAQAVLNVLKTWRNKPVMSDAQAKAVNKQLTATLSNAQLKKLATMQSARGMGGRRPGGMGGPGGGGPSARPGNDRQPGARRFDLSKMPSPKEYNPLNPKTIGTERTRGRMTEQLDALTKGLAQRAK